MRVRSALAALDVLVQIVLLRRWHQEECPPPSLAATSLAQQVGSGGRRAPEVARMLDEDQFLAAPGKRHVDALVREGVERRAVTVLDIPARVAAQLRRPGDQVPPLWRRQVTKASVWSACLCSSWYPASAARASTTAAVRRTGPR